MPLRTRRPLTVAAAAALAWSLCPGAAVAAPSPDLVVAEVYGGGGNSGAPLARDFVELGNRGTAAVDLAGRSVQYLPASAATAWQVTPLAGSLAPGGRVLVGQGAGSGGGTALPPVDVDGSIAMAAGSGTVALVDGTGPLACRTAADCAADPRVRDLVGYGTAVVREGAAAPGLSATTSAARGADLADTDDNAADLVAGAPTPAGSAAPPPPVEARIADVQGTTRLSPLDGAAVRGLPGVVTAVRTTGRAQGFWVQDPAPDDDPRTSEGLLVFTGSTTPDVAVGDAVLLAGTVDEFRPGGPDAPNQTVTQLVGATWTVTGTGVVPAEPVGPGSVPEAYAPSPGGDIEPLPLSPAEFALDFWESREGMRLEVADVRVVGPTTEFGEAWVTVEPEQNAGPRGVTVYASYDQPNGGRLKVESLGAPLPALDVRDALAGATAGVLDYESFGGYALLATSLGTIVDGGLEPEVTEPGRDRELSVATYNVENLSALDPQAKLDRLAAGIATNLAGPDVVALEEVQDDTGPTSDGVVAAGATLGRLVDAIVAAGGPRYEWRQIDPVDGADGGQPGGNIRVAFLVDPTRVRFVDRPGGDATTPVAVVPDRGRAALSVSPGRIEPADPAFEDSRKPLVGEFEFRGRTVFVVANHFVSKGGDQPLHGRFQPPARPSEVQRVAQAEAVRGFVDALYAVDRRADVVVTGDLNDFPFSPVLDVLTAGGALRNPLLDLPVGERYTYVFDGNAQVLDHVLLGRGIRRASYDVVHVNAEFADQVSDHDPQVVRLVP